MARKWELLPMVYKQMLRDRVGGRAVAITAVCAHSPTLACPAVVARSEPQGAAAPLIYAYALVA